jgi:signal transduction histidine kinase
VTSIPVTSVSARLVETREKAASLFARRPLVRDLVVAVLFFAVWNAAIAIALHLDWYPADVDNYVRLGALCAIAIGFCRSFPLPTYVVVGLATACPDWMSSQPELLVVPLIVAVYLATANGLRVRFAVPLTVVFAVFTIVPHTSIGFATQYGFESLVGDLAYMDPSTRALAGVVVAAALLLGLAAHRQRVAVETLRQRNAELHQLREADLARIAAEERTALAREIHDVVAHHVSAMVIRAQAADRVADTRPGELRETVRWIGTSGQEALTAMRQVVRVLRADSTSATPLAPADFGLALDKVVEHVRSTGLHVEATLDLASPLSTAQEFTVLRIVQEALTNVMLHSGAGAVTVYLRSRADTAWLRIEDDGGAPGASPAVASGLTSGGSGLRGMRERAEALGGTFAAGPLDGRGWLVETTLPHAAVPALQSGSPGVHA